MARRQETTGSPRPTFALRLGEDERRILEAAAHQRGEPLSAYIRRSALEKARSEIGSGR